MTFPDISCYELSKLSVRNYSTTTELRSQRSRVRIARGVLNRCSIVRPGFRVLATRVAKPRGFGDTNQISVSNPLRSSRLSSFSEGPLGCFSPISHCRTVDRLVFKTEANTAWLSL